MSKNFFVIVLPLLFLGCKENAPPEPPPYVRSIELEALDASCTEVWLKITLTHPKNPLETTTDSILLARDGQSVQTLRLTTADSILIDEGLLPNRTYTYTAYRLSGTSVSDSSQRVQVTTMDTTSHNFTWQIDTLGDGGGSVLYDVAIINDTLAYAVGEIFHADSSQNWTFFNLAKWDGREWTLQRVYYRQNNIIHTRWILAFAWNDIWITPYTHWDGTAWREVPFDPIFSGVRTNKAWGTSSRDFYVVGDGGFIAHYDGTSWRRIESGTTLPIVDILGVRDANGGYEILAVADGYDRPEGSYVLSIKNNTVHQIWHDPRPYGLDEVWFVPQRKYIVAGSGLWQSYCSQSGSRWTRVGGLPPIHLTCVRGKALNDVFVGGPFWLLAHWNGMSWQTFFPQNASSGFVSVHMRGNLMAAVGGVGNRALTLIGRR